MRVHLIITSIFIAFLAACATGKEATGGKDEKTMQLQQSEKTMAIALKYMDAMNTGDMETMKMLMHEDMVWDNEGDPEMPWIGPWIGKKSILEDFLPLFMEHFKTTKWETEDAMSDGEVACFFGKMKGITLKSGQETTEFTFALRVKVKDEQIILWNWLEDSYAVSQAYHKK